MAILLWLFLLFTSLYHVIVTVLVYGLSWLQPETIVILREGIRFLLLLVLVIAQRRRIGGYLKSTWKLWLVFFSMCILAVIVSYIQGKTNADMMVGAKYGLQFFVVFLSAVFIGHVFAVLPTKRLQKFLSMIFTLFVVIIVLGLIWQVSKIIWPQLFYHLGYGVFGDRVFGQNPPLYYLTGPGGYPRLSGIFSGPNNYGYLFVGLFGFWRWYLRTHIVSKSIKTLLWILFAGSVLWTMSRGAILGIFLQMIALSFVLFHAKRKYIRGLIVAGILVVGALSVVKRGSTLAHVSAKFGSLQYVRANPWGYGLGSSGPSIHTGHGNILPENFFVQILVDIGIPGMILRLLFRYLAMKNIRRVTRGANHSSPYKVLLICLSFSFLGLLLEGMFLHVFEDSMVNYWFFILWGVIYGYVLRKSYYEGIE